MEGTASLVFAFPPASNPTRTSMYNNGSVRLRETKCAVIHLRPPPTARGPRHRSVSVVATAGGKKRKFGDRDSDAGQVPVDSDRTKKQLRMQIKECDSMCCSETATSAARELESNLLLREKESQAARDSLEEGKESLIFRLFLEVTTDMLQSSVLSVTGSALAAAEALAVTPISGLCHFQAEVEIRNPGGNAFMQTRDMSRYCGTRSLGFRPVQYPLKPPTVAWDSNPRPHIIVEDGRTSARKWLKYRLVFKTLLHTYKILFDALTSQDYGQGLPEVVVEMRDKFVTVVTRRSEGSMLYTQNLYPYTLTHRGTRSYVLKSGYERLAKETAKINAAKAALE
ncbi:hypothetical protein R3P38DRAFT_2792553 [Favolaschia claudopus]|uniref:Uncharacterized protein n=1 Tax=Favolaschia claudopus TaxID=2862362 RepID=A0AAW0AFW6_9AGAR